MRKREEGGCNFNCTKSGRVQGYTSKLHVEFPFTYPI